MATWLLILKQVAQQSDWYHGNINIHGLGVGHPKDSIGGLKGGSLNGSPIGELPFGESLGCPPSSGWWSKPMGIWVSKLVVTYTMVVTRSRVPN